MMDNARPHTAVITQPYLVIRPVQYDSKDEVVKAAQHCLLSLPEDYLIHEFYKFLGHCKAVIRSGGDYVTC